MYKKGNLFICCKEMLFIKMAGEYVGYTIVLGISLTQLTANKHTGNISSTCIH